MKDALLKGIPVGLILALIVIGVRTLLGDVGFLDNLKTVYGILTLICFPVAFVAIFYTSQKKK